MDLKRTTPLQKPKNETEAHFVLKEISKYILWGWGYNKLGTEVDGMYSFDRTDNVRKKRGMKNIIDVVGIKKTKDLKGFYYEAKGIEAKISMSDFNNDFCSATAYTYIIAPKGVIPLNKIPEKIGFIEVDFKNFKLPKNSQKISDMSGVFLIKKAKKNIDSRFETKEKYKKWTSNLLEKISYRCGAELLFWRNYIEFTK